MSDRATRIARRDRIAASAITPPSATLGMLLAAAIIVGVTTGDWTFVAPILGATCGTVGLILLARHQRNRRPSR